MTTEKLTTVVEKLCVGGKGYPTTGGDGAVVKVVTNELVWLIRVILFDLFTNRRSSVRWVKETQQLDQEEGLALTLAHLLGYELLPEEARTIGELARKAAIAYKGKPPGVKGKPLKEKPADQALKDNACKKKGKAKDAAAKDAGLAAVLAETLEGIDAVLATDRRQLARAPVALPWPPRLSVIRVQPPPKPPPKLKTLRQKVALLQAEVMTAEADSVAARRVAERLSHIAREMEAITHAEARCGELGDEAWEALVAQRNSAQDAALDAQSEYHAALRWLEELRDGVEDAREAVRDEEEAQAEARAAEAAAPVPVPAPTAAQREIAERLAALKLEHEQALAQLTQREAQMQAVLARAPPPREGTVADPAAVGRVFKLTGLSAADVNGMAASVSQAKTGALWDSSAAWDRYDDAVRKPRDSSPDM